MGVCTCWTAASGREVKCQWHGGTTEDRIFEAESAIHELEQELRDWRKELKRLKGS